MSDLRLGDIILASLYRGTTPIKAVYMGSHKVWPVNFSAAVMATSVSLVSGFVRLSVVASSSSVCRPLVRAHANGVAISVSGTGAGGFSEGFGSGYSGGNAASDGKGFNSGFSSGFKSSNS